jgi:arginyl-tRNA synthetase
MQLVRLVEGREIVKMSKRTGAFVTLEELVEEVGLDVARWFFLERAPETHMDFDLALAKEQSEKNPVFYVQYAHARIKSIMAKGKEEGLLDPEKLAMPDFAQKVDFGTLGKEDIQLARYLFRFTVTVQNSARQMDPSLMTIYLRDLATKFQRYYTAGDRDKNLRVLCEDKNLRDARLFLCSAVANVIKKGLELLGVSAPDRM